MKKNMGQLDKVIRLIAAVIMVGLVVTKVVSGIPGIVLVVLASVFVLTSFISFCPLYLPLGINTCKGEK